MLDGLWMCLSALSVYLYLAVFTVILIEFWPQCKVGGLWRSTWEGLEDSLEGLVNFAERDEKCVLVV